METVLVDTSVWIDFLKNARTKQTLFLEDNITNIIIATCPAVIQEVLQGIVSDKDEKTIKMHFDNLLHLIEDPYQVAIRSAELYRFLRKQGITIRKPNDCLIAMYAIKANIPILHNDRDFEFIAEHSALKIIR